EDRPCRRQSPLRRPARRHPGAHPPRDSPPPPAAIAPGIRGLLPQAVRAGQRPSGFFFQAEDGIRDRNVTGVQTCALPISMWDPDWPDGQRPCDLARKRLGRIAIANSDAAAAAYTDQAIDQAYRAVQELA